MYRLLACRNFSEMNVSLISMKNVMFLLVNPHSKWSKSQNFSCLRRARWSLIILRIPDFEITTYCLLAFRKSAQMPMYRLLRGGVYYQLRGKYYQRGGCQMISPLDTTNLVIKFNLKKGAPGATR